MWVVQHYEIHTYSIKKIISKFPHPQNKSIISELETSFLHILPKQLLWLYQSCATATVLRGYHIWGDISSRITICLWLFSCLLNTVSVHHRSSWSEHHGALIALLEMHERKDPLVGKSAAGGITAKKSHSSMPQLHIWPQAKL